MVSLVEALSTSSLEKRNALCHHENILMWFVYHIFSKISKEADVGGSEWEESSKSPGTYMFTVLNMYLKIFLILNSVTEGVDVSRPSLKRVQRIPAPAAPVPTLWCGGIWIEMVEALGWKGIPWLDLSKGMGVGLEEGG